MLSGSTIDLFFWVLSRQQWKIPGCLDFIEGYTTQLYMAIIYNYPIIHYKDLY